MKLTRKRAILPMVAALEGRLLLDAAAPTATWIGQDGHDLVGPTWVPGGDDVQDIRISIQGLKPDRQVVYADVRGLGGGQWLYNGPPGGPWAAALVREPGTSTADLFIEPFAPEFGRRFSVELRYSDDGPSDTIWLDGGRADPNLRMPSAALKLNWVGQDGSDRVGPGPSVGPDGVQDIRLALANLSTGVGIESATLSAPDGTSWRFGVNRQLLPNAELVRRGDNPAQADLYVNPAPNLEGKTLTLTLQYTNGKSDSANLIAGRVNAALPAATPGPVDVSWGVLTPVWVGQDADSAGQRGDVKVHVGSIPAGRAIVAAVVANSVGQSWTFRGTGSNAVHLDGSSAPLAVRRSADGTSADIFFAPSRDETGSELTIRLVLDDGTQLASAFAGGKADTSLRAAGIADTAVDARPGDDLNDLANRFGTVRLAPGTYELDRPLILNNPVRLVAEAGATLRFTQPAAAAAWSTAIKIHAGNTTLEGFTVRFAGPVRWRGDVSYGPAVIGTTDNHDAQRPDPKVGIRVLGLDVESPPVAPGSFVEAPRMLRLVSASDGTIVGNRFKGGAIEFFGGPWTITDNDYRGTVPGTYAFDFIAAHATHDLTVERNVARPDGPSGKTWRFLVMTFYGFNDVVRDNQIAGLGPRDGESLDMNTNEIILTEGYNIQFEGTPSHVSADGRVVQVPFLQGGAVRVGDVVSVLAGPGAGQWRQVTQVLGRTAYLLDDPLPEGTTAIQVSTGFVNEVFEGNTVDSRGSRKALNLALVGNHFGTRVVDNRLLGGNDALKLTAAPSENPVMWGWSHVPFLGGLISGNWIEDAWSGAELSVEHSVAIKTNEGRVYFSAELTDNVVAWSAEFLKARAEANLTGPPTAFAIGNALSTDPGELLLRAENNRVIGPRGYVPGETVRVAAATINGEILVDHRIRLVTVAPQAPGSIALLADTGADASDGLTADGRIALGDSPTAVAYEYRLDDDEEFRPVSAADGFLPDALVQGANVVRVRSIDATGNRGPEAVYRFELDTVAPDWSVAALRPSSDSGRADHDRLTRETRPEFEAEGQPDHTLILLRDGSEVARRVGGGILQEPGPLADGSHTYRVRTVDRAGNSADGPELTITIDTEPPPAVAGLTALPGLMVAFAPTGDVDVYEYRLAGWETFVPLGGATTFRPAGLAWGENRVVVRAIDAAGNVGPEGEVIVVKARPRIRWAGQSGQDRVGAGTGSGPDGRQDVRLEVTEILDGRTIVAAEVLGVGGGFWTYGGTGAGLPLAFADGDTPDAASLFLQPLMVETGRPFAVQLQFDDGSTVELALAGGQADPGLWMPGQEPLPIPIPAPPPAPAPDPAPPVSPIGSDPGVPADPAPPPAADPAPAPPASEGPPVVISPGWRRRALIQARQQRAAALRQRQKSQRPAAIPRVKPAVQLSQAAKLELLARRRRATGR